jgi:hypothetical protein
MVRLDQATILTHEGIDGANDPGVMAALPICADCSLPSPETKTPHTLIKFGWRVRGRRDALGATVFEWRCPACWAKTRQAGSTS